MSETTPPTPGFPGPPQGFQPPPPGYPPPAPGYPPPSPGYPPPPPGYPAPQGFTPPPAYPAQYAPPGAPLQPPSGRYPVQVTFEYPGANSRLFAIPILGGLLRVILLIPHIIALYIVGAIVGLMSYVILAFITLFTGRMPRWGYAWVGGYIRWIARLQAYFFGLTDKYPPFGFGD